jgi:deferrochelatase/peroxidase EfeB
VSLDRRRFLTRGAALLGAGIAGAGLEREATAEPAVAAPDAATVARGTLARRLPFDGPHQAGVLAHPAEQAVAVSLDVIAADRAALIGGLRTLSARARELTAGAALPSQEVDEPPADSGTLGPDAAPDALTVTVGFGASLFDDRYGLARSRPRGLTAMPAFPDDDLDPARLHGDVLLLIGAQRKDTVVHALRELIRPVRDAFAVRWALDGFSGADRGPSARSSRRNHFGFRDGTGNPDTADDALMRRLIWDRQGGTFAVVRAIRMHVEFWDRVGLREQEAMIGRRRDTGAPLGGRDEYQDPDYPSDPTGERVPLDAHIRLANPRTDASADERILRRGWNYHRGFDAGGRLDMGLLFVAFNRDVQRQFEVVQRRLAGEPMTDYVTPVGGGYFYVPRGSQGAGDWVGSGLFSS